jgi:dihydropteroate synthase
VDTVKPGVARAAIAAGAGMINDVSNLRDGVGLAEQAAEGGAYLVLMHSRGTPETMQRQTAYSDVVQEIAEALMKSAQKAIGCGVPKEKIWLDPGIGFAKTAEQSIEILCRLEEITALDHPVLVGPSRKSFIGKITGADIHNRLGGTAAAVTAAVMKGASAVRVHDVATMRQASLIARELSRAGGVVTSKREAANA